jgi:hypothetical protein
MVYECICKYTQNPNFSIPILDVLGLEDFRTFMAIWCIFWAFCTFYDHLVYFLVFWYILWPFGTFLMLWYAVPGQIWQPCRRVEKKWLS